MNHCIDELKALLAEGTSRPWTGIYQISGEDDVALANAAINSLPALIAAVEALKAIVELDDGDKPDLWHFEKEFEAGRAALAKFGE